MLEPSGGVCGRGEELGLSAVCDECKMCRDLCVNDQCGLSVWSRDFNGVGIKWWKIMKNQFSRNEKCTHSNILVKEKAEPFN